MTCYLSILLYVVDFGYLLSIMKLKVIKEIKGNEKLIKFIYVKFFIE